jgi:hypothetical protein
MTFKSREVIEHNRKTALTSVDGKSFDYVSTKGKGYEQITYQRRAPMVGGKIGALNSTTVKMKDLPSVLIHDLNAAHKDGNLREELGRHLAYLEENKIVDPNTLGMLRGYQRDLLGLHEPDAEILDCVTGVIQSLRPTERQP